MLQSILCFRPIISRPPLLRKLVIYNGVRNYGQYRWLRYNPLTQPDSIRLVELQPGNPEDELRVEIQHARLSEAPEYETLSYEWAGNRKEATVRCGRGEEIPVPLNLRAALKRLRDRDRPRRIWIDAICINQDDLKERGAQVSIMTQIYQKAQGVLIWIREQKPNTVEAFKMIPKLADSWDSQGPQDDPTSTKPPVEVKDEHADELDNPTISSAIFDAFTRSYFTRTWIIQEILVSKKATVICGSHQIDWVLFHQAANYLVQREFHLSTAPAPRTLFLVALIRRNEKRYKARQLNLRTLLRHFRYSQATDIRDKVYAMLGISFQVGRSGTGLDVHPLQPDYTKAVEDVYREAAAYIMTDEQDLRLLANEYSPCSRHLTKMPTWVPDWSITSKRLLPMARKSNVLSFLIKGDISTRGHSLFVNGLKFDTVTYATPIVTRENEATILETLTSLVSSKNQYPYSNQSLTEALCRTLIADNANFRPALDHDERYFFHLLRKRMKTIDIPIIQEDLMTDLRYQTVSHQLRNNEPYREELNRNLHGRSFFMTARGFMGLGPKAREAVRVGDRICILGGGYTPLILREGSYFGFKEKSHKSSWKSKDRNDWGAQNVQKHREREGEEEMLDEKPEEKWYRLVGESYVHGVMDGECLKSEITSEKIQRIEIR
ncbi:heterokaryon incompatibility protein-domain-containing protein [Tuber borchii]|uniref:Heterokaryon incompatibility protein-domain-containing protein n=1 Tax=Tuber borchii TaxID=42251 RepID=A0A2T6ZQF7_TUBBO|nr:heterokaryon incompatibility protein-domain-containing protein [Tuber borchii]